MAKNKWMYKYANSHTIERISSGGKKKYFNINILYNATLYGWQFLPKTLHFLKSLQTKNYYKMKLFLNC